MEVGEYQGWTQMRLASIYAEIGNIEKAKELLAQVSDYIDINSPDVKKEYEQIETLISSSNILYS